MSREQDKGGAGMGTCRGSLALLQNLFNKTVFFQGLFPPGQGATIGVDFMIKTVEINGEKVKVGT